MSIQLEIIDNEPHFQIHASLDGIYAGYAYFELKGADMFLSDICVREHEVVPSRKWWQLPKLSQPRKLREQGIGTAMISKVIEEAQIRQCERIYGYITIDSIRDNPHLDRWYEKRGFLVQPSDGNTWLNTEIMVEYPCAFT
ncbi:GNAT family N-acetyltransferase [Rubritalea tangerina]|uniref:GNAT family N-acetyltransferase n=1 Tax=Rubritalea tangerina TaxID=430798 RepID=A0ABW4Z6K7_9BACT